MSLKHPNPDAAGVGSDPAEPAPTAPAPGWGLADWLAYLERLHPTTIDLGLERIRQVAGRLPLDLGGRLVVTVGGTNGKGTTVTLLSHILRAAGRRTGVYTSPHLLRYNERVLLDGRQATDEELCAAFAEVERAREGVSLTYFEFGTLAALLLFTAVPLDALILEVGLGGRLDAVNIVDPDVAILTNVALDHMDWLGGTREAIGREKAGIFRPGRPAIYGETDMPASVAQAAEALGARLYRQGREFHWRQGEEGRWHWRGLDAQGGSLEWRDLPACAFAPDNVGCVLQAVALLGLDLPRVRLEESLRQASLTGRFQRVERDGRTFVLDVAHNPHAAGNLAASLRRAFPGRRLHMVIAMLRDKDAAGVVESLSGLETVMWYVGEIQDERGAPAEILYNALRSRGENAACFTSVEDAWEAAGRTAAPGEIVVVTGSFHTVTAVLARLAGPSLNSGH